MVEVSKVQKIFEKRKALQETVFTPAEILYSMRRRYPFHCLAARFAVKEALFKALGTGLSGKMDWREVELQEESSGTPELRFLGEAARVARRRGVVGHAVSLSRTADYTAALVLLVVNRE